MCVSQARPKTCSEAFFSLSRHRLTPLCRRLGQPLLILCLLQSECSGLFLSVRLASPTTHNVFLPSYIHAKFQLSAVSIPRAVRLQTCLPPHYHQYYLRSRRLEHHRRAIRCAFGLSLGLALDRRASSHSPHSTLHSLIPLSQQSNHRASPMSEALVAAAVPTAESATAERVASVAAAAPLPLLLLLLLLLLLFLPPPLIPLPPCPLARPLSVASPPLLLLFLLLAPPFPPLPPSIPPNPSLRPPLSLAVLLR